MPKNVGYGTDKESLDYLMGQLSATDSVLEFGPGDSTEEIANKCHLVVSFENVQKWTKVAQKRFANFGNVKIVKYDYQVEIDVSSENFGNKFDVAFVDGPKAGVQQLPRLLTLICAIKNSNVVFMHDANRKGERATVDVAKLIFPNRNFEFIDIGRGLVKVT